MHRRHCQVVRHRQDDYNICNMYQQCLQQCVVRLTAQLERLHAQAVHILKHLGMLRLAESSLITAHVSVSSHLQYVAVMQESVQQRCLCHVNEGC